MPGIELSNTEEDLVFDERPKDKDSLSGNKVPGSAEAPVLTVNLGVKLELEDSHVASSGISPKSTQPMQEEGFGAPKTVVPLETEAEFPDKHQTQPQAQPQTQPQAQPQAQHQVQSQAQPQIQPQPQAQPQPQRQPQPQVQLDTKRDSLELFEILLASALKGGASDVLLKQGQVPMFRWNGELFPSRNGPRLDAEFFNGLMTSLLNDSYKTKLNAMQDVDLSFQSQRAGRVRINMFHQRGDLSLVARLVPMEIPSFEKLEMGTSIRQLADQKRGLILVTGATGSGKSTTLAAMLDYINSTRTSHIITIEDPIEFVHSDKRSMFNQRELGLDTQSYAQALKSALRQAPDVILVGELRDTETIEVALQAAETGHLVLSTLHTNDAADSILRIIGMVGRDKEGIVRAQLSDSLRGVVSQRLVKRKDRPGRVAAQEIMINTATIREKLAKGGHPSLVRDFIVQGGHSGMQSFDQHLIQLVRAGIIEYEEALRNATNRDDFALRFNGVDDGRAVS
jgi:twitching motility protein PilT